MIIDFHANYNHNSFKNSFRYLTRNKNGYTIAEGDREAVIEKNIELKGITSEEVEKATAENAIRLFCLLIEMKDSCL